jgi:hypothetical protein
MHAYTSCNCRQCRLASPAIKDWHKKMAHRAMRRANKEALRSGKDAPMTISTGYKD